MISSILILALPFFCALIFFVADVANMVVAKETLQVAADRASYAAATQLSEIMNKVAGMNWQIHRKFSDLKTEMEDSTQRQSQNEGKKKIEMVQHEIDDIRSEMDGLVDAGYREACQKAVQESARWAPRARPVPLYGGVRTVGEGSEAACDGGDALFGFGNTSENIDMVDDEEQWPEVQFGWPEGGDGFPDPAATQSDSMSVLSYRVKAPRPDGAPDQVAFALRLEDDAPESTLAMVFKERLQFRASSAAQPYGGSIKNTAFAEVDSQEDAVQAAPYSPTLVPLDTLRNYPAGYRGLRYWSEDESDWAEDETQYLH